MSLNPKTAVNMTRPHFAGEHSDLLDYFYELLTSLWERHYTSPVFAGDEMIFALGGNGYETVFSHLGFDALVEIKSPYASIDLRPSLEEYPPIVSISRFDSPEGMNVEAALRDFFKGIIDYYERGPRLRL